MAQHENRRHPSSYLTDIMPALDVLFLNNATFDDISLRSEIISLFRQQLATLADQFTVPLDQSSWAYLTHTLKGSASAVGAMQLAAMADQWEAGAFPHSASARSNYARELSHAVATFNAAADQL
jgi:HPt (histidine-containing phosphotransfer) domain-containing protein